MPPISRRLFLTRCVALGVFFGTKIGYAASRPPEHFAGEPFSDSVTRLFGNQPLIDSNRISLSLPQVAENGAVVPITIDSDLDNIERIYILVEKNPTPLAAEFELSPDALPYITARIKMAESCNVVVVAKRGEQLLRAQQPVMVMLGGCGTG